MSKLRVVGRARHRPKAKKSTKQTSIFAILRSLRSLGLRSLNRSLIWIASCSLVGGLSQAALLVIITELAASHAEGSGNLKIHGLSIPLHDSILPLYRTANPLLSVQHDCGFRHRLNVKFGSGDGSRQDHGLVFQGQLGHSIGGTARSRPTAPHGQLRLYCRLNTSYLHWAARYFRSIGASC